MRGAIPFFRRLTTRSVAMVAMLVLLPFSTLYFVFSNSASNTLIDLTRDSLEEK